MKSRPVHILRMFLYTDFFFDNSHQDSCYWPLLMSEIAVLQLLSMRKSQGASDNFHHI